MAPLKSITKQFKRKKTGDKNKVVVAKEHDGITEISIARVDKNQVTPMPTTTRSAPRENIDYMDETRLRSLLKKREEKIAALERQVADLSARLDEREEQAKSCSCGAYQRKEGPSQKWRHSRW